jgi:hypothetical protein
MGVSRSDRPARRPRKGLAFVPPARRFSSASSPDNADASRDLLVATQSFELCCADVHRQGCAGMLQARRPSDLVEIAASTARAFTASLQSGTPSHGSRPWPLSWRAAMADPSDPRCGERRLRAGPVAGDAHVEHGGSVAAMKDSALSKRRGG